MAKDHDVCAQEVPKAEGLPAESLPIARERRPLPPLGDIADLGHHLLPDVHANSNEECAALGFVVIGAVARQEQIHAALLRASDEWEVQDPGTGCRALAEFAELIQYPAATGGVKKTQIPTSTASVQRETIPTQMPVLLACPCLHTTPCDPRCTCLNPVSSRGCSRCCSYGSKGQQKAKAEAIIARSESAERIETVGLDGDVLVHVRKGRLWHVWGGMATVLPREESLRLAREVLATDQPPRLCVAVIVRNRDGHVLAGQRNKDPLRGYWVLPGGGIEASETWREAAIREVREETGLEVQIDARQEPIVVEHEAADTSGRRAVVLFVQGRAEGTPVGADDLMNPGWFGRFTIPSPKTPATIEALDRWLDRLLATGER